MSSSAPVEDGVRLDRAALAIGALAMVLLLPALQVGTFADDAWWRMADQARAPGVGPFDLRYAPKAAREFWQRRGVGFWWTDEAFRWSFLRPLSTAMMRLQWACFGATSAGWQTTSLVGYAVLLAVLWRLYRRALSGPVALVALFVFATQFSHLQTVWFAANSHTWLAVTPTLAGLLAWLRWRETGWRPGPALAALGLGLGLAAGETALGGLAFVVAREAVDARPRWRVLAGAIAAGALYTALHGALGYGTRASSLYLDPRAQPLDWLAAAPARLATLVTGALGVLPADLWLAEPRLRPVLVGAAPLALLILGALLRRARAALDPRDREAARWLVLGALGTLPLVLGAPPGGRVLLWATVGSAVPLAMALVAAAQAARRQSPGWRAQLAATAPLFLAVALPLLGLPLQLRSMAERAAALREAAADAEIDEATVGEERVVIFNLPDAWMALYLLPTRIIAWHGTTPADWISLSPASADQRLTRTGPDTLELTVLDGALWTQPFEQLFLWPDTRATVGATFQRGPLRAELREVGAEGPTRVAFTFDPPLDAPGWRFLSWRDGRLRQAALPKVGETVALPWSPSPFPRGR